MPLQPHEPHVSPDSVDVAYPERVECVHHTKLVLSPQSDKPFESGEDHVHKRCLGFRKQLYKTLNIRVVCHKNGCKLTVLVNSFIIAYLGVGQVVALVVVQCETETALVAVTQPHASQLNRND